MKTARQDPALAKSYLEADRDVRVRHARVGCVLALVLMPAGISLDYFVYPERIWDLLQIRLLCDLGVGIIMGLLYTAWGRNQVRVLGIAWALLPGLSIAWMIAITEGLASPYYAGLNLVMIAVCLLMPWTLGEVLATSSLTLLMYLAACFYYGSVRADFPTLYSNVYFILLTAILCGTGSFFTSRRRFEEFRLRYELDRSRMELAQNEKMRALGSLAAGLLHEINNPLNITITALQVARDQAVHDPESLGQTFDDIGQGMDRIRRLIADLRSFAQPDRGNQDQEFPLEQALDQALRFAAGELHDIKVDHPETKGLPVRGSPARVTQVLLNLVLNAAQALKGSPPAQEPRISVRADKVGNRVQVSVADNGPGIPRENLDRILDPFFTTKDPGQGMGLGLSVCHTLVRGHGGSMAVRNRPGGGAEISFDLPWAGPKEDE